MSEETNRRTEIKDLPKEEEALSPEEQKKVQGGAIRKAVMNTGLTEEPPKNIDGSGQ